MSIYAIRNGLRVWSETNPADFGWGAVPFPVIVTPDMREGIYAIPRCASCALIVGMAEKHYPEAAEEMKRAIDIVVSGGEPELVAEICYRVAASHNMLVSNPPDTLAAYAIIRDPMARITSALSRVIAQKQYIDNRSRKTNDLLISLSKCPPSMVDVHFRPYFIGIRESLTGLFVMESGGMDKLSERMGIAVPRLNSEGERITLDPHQQAFIDKMYLADYHLWRSATQGGIE